MFLWIATLLAALPAPSHHHIHSLYDSNDKFAPWTCLECDHENHYDDDYCRVCEAPNPDPLRVDPYTGYRIDDNPDYWD